MASIPGENVVPLGRAGTGSAVILGNNLAPLRILQQADSLRARRAAQEAALKQKQAQEIARQWSEDRKLNLDTGGLFQQAFNDYTANAQDVIGGNFAQEQAGKLTTQQRVQANANYINEVTRERLLGVDKDKTIAAYETAQAGKPFRDTQGLHTAIGESVLGPDGKRVRASTYDERGILNQLEADPRTYAVAPILDDYYKGLQASTMDDANAGRIGGIHSSSSITYKGLIPVRRADGTWDVKRAAPLPGETIGRPVIGTTADELATARASNHNLNMAVSRLEKDYANRRAEDPSLPERSPLDLFQEASRKYVSFRQADSEGRNAQPRQSAAGKPKFVTNANTNGGAGFVPIMDNGQEVGYPSTYIGQAPTKTKVSTGETVGYGYDGAQHGQYILRIPGKNDEVVSNSREPQNVQYGSHFTALVTKSGKPVRPVDKQGNPVNLQGQDLLDFYRREREKDPSLTVETVINGSPRKGKNELGDRQGIADQLQAQYESLPRSAQRKKARPTREQLLKDADDIIAKQNASYQYVYRGTTKREIDSYAPGAYNSKEKAAEIERARREADEASRPKASPGGSVYRRPGATTPTTAPSRGGSIYKTR